MRRGRDLAAERCLRERSKIGTTWLLCLVLSTLVFGAYETVTSGGTARGEESRAMALMRETSAVLKARRASIGAPPDPANDPTGTGLIGNEYGVFTTSLGKLEAKRTAASPSMAALATRLLRQVGVRKGDCIAIGASGSFPGLVVAVLSASQTIGAHAILVCSEGASTWGANDAAFNLFDLLGWLSSGPLADFQVVLATPGGDADAGIELDPATLALIRRKAHGAALPFWEPPTLREAVEKRVRLYREAAGARPIACYVNIGGNVANMGSGYDVLALKPGVASIDFRSVPKEHWGVSHEMAAAGVPVLHLLNIRGLVTRYGFDWDPSQGTTSSMGVADPLAAVAYLFMTSLILGAGLLLSRHPR